MDRIKPKIRITPDGAIDFEVEVTRKERAPDPPDEPCVVCGRMQGHWNKRQASDPLLCTPCTDWKLKYYGRMSWQDCAWFGDASGMVKALEYEAKHGAGSKLVAGGHAQSFNADQ